MLFPVHTLWRLQKGNRPSYSKAAKPQKAKDYYERFIEYLNNKYNIKVETGVFQASMEVDFINDGPVTLMLDSKKYFKDKKNGTYYFNKRNIRIKLIYYRK